MKLRAIGVIRTTDGRGRRVVLRHIKPTRYLLILINFFYFDF
jgi:hypothetical protein